MTKAELESKHLADLHSLAAEAGVERYRMLTRGELIEKLSGGGDGAGGPRGESRPRRRPEGERGERPPRRRRRRSAAGENATGGSSESRARPEPTPPERAPAPPKVESKPSPPPAVAASDSSPRPKRRRRRRFGRRNKQGVTLQGLLLPPESGRQALLCAETGAGCTSLLRGVAADLAADSKGPDPVVLLIDPSPEELADWKRDAPQAEIVAAGQPRHASDALAQAAARAGGGEDVILLVDSLTRLADAYGDPDAAKTFFDAGRAQAAAGTGSLTVVAALERPVTS